MPAPIEVWFEFASTYSHVAVQRIVPLAEAAGVRILWQPFLLGPIFRRQGWDDSPFNVYPVKGAYMWRDMERLCEKHRIPFSRPSVFPRNGLLAARLVVACETEPWAAALIRAVYLANFRDDQDISSADCLRHLLQSVGCGKPAGALERALSEPNKARLRDRTERAVQLGIFGAPTFRVQDELFWGSDRLEDALAWCGRC